jgi:putative flippase GtrA
MFGEAWRFGVVGAANVVINFVVFNALALTLFPDGELKANVVATAFATTTSYLMNRSWTFRHRKTTRIPREYVLFFLFNAAGLAIELAVMGAAKYGLGITALWALNVAKALGLGLGTVFRFWTYRTFVFSGTPGPVAEVDPARSGPVLPAPARSERAPAWPGHVPAEQAHELAPADPGHELAHGPARAKLAIVPLRRPPAP